MLPGDTVRPQIRVDGPDFRIGGRPTAHRSGNNFDSFRRRWLRPLWNQNQGNVAAAQAAVRRANANRDSVQLELSKQLTEALQRYRIAEQGVKSLEEGILPDAMRTLDLVQSAYARGQFDITRLLQTQRSVFEANLDYISALVNRLAAAAEIAGLMQLDEFP